MKKTYLTVTDGFCGAGGSSIAVRNAARKMGGGLEVTLAMNHWALAIETHNTNFPETIHVCTDISACDPRRYPSTDIAVMSPECTTYSPSGGNTYKAVKKQMDMFTTGELDASAERSRATMWDVCRFAEFHKYNCIIVENVVEAKTRWPLFDVWLNAMFTLGYNHKCVYLNSMHCHPTPQSRDRMYVVFWKKGNKAPDLDFMPSAWSPKAGKDVRAVQSWKNPLKKFGKYKQQYVYCCPITGDIVEPYYYASGNIIDWSDLGKRIGDRKKPLAPKSNNRIQYGLDKYENYPFIFPTNYSDNARDIVKSIGQALGSQTTFAGSQALVNPFIFKMSNSKKPEGYVYPLNQVVGAQTSCEDLGLVLGSMPLMVENKGTSLSRGIDKPLSTATTTGYHGLLTDQGFKSFLSAYNNGSHCTKAITDAAGCFPTKERMALVNYAKPNIEDCYYRMLKSSEIQRGMAFDDDYIILGSSKNQVKQLGNAVTPPAMQWLIEQVVESLN